MDIKFTRDEEEVLLFLDGKHTGSPISDIRKGCPVNSAIRVKSVLENLIRKNTVDEYWEVKFRNNKTEMSPVYILTKKGRDAVEWM